MRFATRSVFFCNKNVLQRVQRDFTIKKKKRERPMKRGEREREKRRPTKNGTLCPAVFRVYSIFFFSFFGRGKRGGGWMSLIRDAFVNTKLLFLTPPPFFFNYEKGRQRPILCLKTVVLYWCSKTFSTVVVLSSLVCLCIASFFFE